MRRGILLLWFFVTAFCQAQTLRNPLAANYIGLDVYSSYHPDAFSFTVNQASLASVKNFSAGVYGERRFLLRELNNFLAVLVLPASSGNFGARAGYSGFKDYNETQLGIAYGRKLGSRVDIGVQFNYHTIHIAGYGNASVITVEAGAILHLAENLHTGIHVANPAGGYFGKSFSEKLPAVYTMGLGYDASEKFFISAEIKKEEDQPVNITAGLQYKFLPQLLTRIGISATTSSVWIGIGIILPAIQLDITTAYHPQLGISPGLLVLFNLDNK